MRLLATFYTHSAAIVSSRNLNNIGIDNKMAPVPRSISSSCGVCVLYETDGKLCLEQMHEELEAVYKIVQQEKYQLVFESS